MLSLRLIAPVDSGVSSSILISASQINDLAAPKITQFLIFRTTFSFRYSCRLSLDLLIWHTLGAFLPAPWSSAPVAPEPAVLGRTLPRRSSGSAVKFAPDSVKPLTAAESAYVRAWAEGLEVRSAWSRFLSGEDVHHAVCRAASHGPKPVSSHASAGGVEPERR